MNEIEYSRNVSKHVDDVGVVVCMGLSPSLSHVTQPVIRLRVLLYAW